MQPSSPQNRFSANARWLGAATAALGVACAPVVSIVPTPVGPDPRVLAAAGESKGGIVVFTDVRVDDEHYSYNDDRQRVHATYLLFDADRRPLQRVANDTGFEGPVVVDLAPGTYVVRGPGLFGPDNYRHEVEVVVNVEAGKVTEVHLDEPWAPPFGFSGKGLSAKAPNGQRIGWSAQAAGRLGVAGELRYVGSPTLASVVGAARAAYGSATFSLSDHDGDLLRDLELGTADLIGIAGPVRPTSGVSCSVVAQNRLSLVVRNDSPLEAIDSADLGGLLTGTLHDWSQLGAAPSPIILVAARHDGVETLASGTRAVVADDKDIVQQAANSPAVIGLVSRVDVRGSPSVRTVRLEDAASAALTVPLTLCAAKASFKAQAFMRWVSGARGQEVVNRQLASSR